MNRLIIGALIVISGIMTSCSNNDSVNGTNDTASNTCNATCYYASGCAGMDVGQFDPNLPMCTATNTCNAVCYYTTGCSGLDVAQYDPKLSMCEGSYSSSSENDYSSSSYIPAVVLPNAIALTLTEYKENGYNDAFNGNADPVISFMVESYFGQQLKTAVDGKTLLTLSDVGTWSGSVKDTLDIYEYADSVVVHGVVLDRDVSFNDDISPSYMMSVYNFENGDFNTFTLAAGSGGSSISFSYRFIRR